MSSNTNFKGPVVGPTSAAKKKRGGRRRRTALPIDTYDVESCVPGIVEEVVSSIVRVKDFRNDVTYTCAIRNKVPFRQVKKGTLVIIGFDEGKKTGEVWGIYTNDAIEEISTYFGVNALKIRTALGANTKIERDIGAAQAIGHTHTRTVEISEDEEDAENEDDEDEEDEEDEEDDEEGEERVGALCFKSK